MKIGNDNKKKLPLACSECVKCGVVSLPAAIVFCGDEFFVCAHCAEGHLPITRQFIAEALIG